MILKSNVPIDSIRIFFSHYYILPYFQKRIEVIYSEQDRQKHSVCGQWWLFVWFVYF